MRLVITLCLLVALCTATPAWNDLEILRLQVRNAKWNVESVVRHLQLLRTQTEEDTLVKVSKRWNEEQDSHRAYKTLLLNAVHTELETAKADGKKVGNCYDEAVDGIVKNEDIAYEDAGKCEDTARNNIQNNLGFVDNLILTGNELSLELDNIFLNCHDSDVLRMQSCIISELARINKEVDVLQTDTNSAEVTAVPVSHNVVLQTSNCLKKAYSFVYSAGTVVKMRVAQCVEKANETKNPKDPKDPEDPKDFEDPKDPKDSNDSKDSEDPTNPKDLKNPKDRKDPKDPKDSKEP